MHTQHTASMNAPLPRRHLLGGAAALAAAACLPRAARAQPGAQPRRPQRDAFDVDQELLTFALNLEYLEAEYYNRGVFGRSLEEEGIDVGRNPGAVRGGSQVRFSRRDLRDFAAELAFNETGHVKLYRQALGSRAVDRPPIDFVGGFNQAGRAAGLIPPGGSFDPFANEMNFFLGGMLFEDAGVTAYVGASPLVTDEGLRDVIAGVLAAESYHMGMVRTLLYQMGPPAWDAANAISEARDRLDGTPNIDQGIRVDQRANIVPTDDLGVVFSRTPRQLLNIVFLQPGAMVGGFYPRGFNGDISALL